MKLSFSPLTALVLACTLFGCSKPTPAPKSLPVVTLSSVSISNTQESWSPWEVREAVTSATHLTRFPNAPQTSITIKGANGNWIDVPYELTTPLARGIQSIVIKSGLPDPFVHSASEDRTPNLAGNLDVPRICEVTLQRYKTIEILGNATYVKNGITNSIEWKLTAPVSHIDGHFRTLIEKKRVKVKNFVKKFDDILTSEVLGTSSTAILADKPLSIDQDIIFFAQSSTIEEDRTGVINSINLGLNEGKVPVPDPNS